MHLIDWNTEHAAKLWSEGLSTGRIAEQIGVTKSMVCGYAGRNRDQFPERGSPVKRSGEAPKRPYKDRKAKPKTDSVRSDGAIGLLRAQIASLPRPRVIAPAIKPPDPAVPMNRTCLFPMWDHVERATHVYCDAPTAGTYCAEHRAICFSTVIRWGMAA